MRTSLLILLPILASLRLLATAVDADAVCPSATCGNLTLAYPFWLATSQDGSSCGPPAFRLTCNDSVSSGVFLSNSYIKVLSIDYDSRSLVAVHALLAADTACTVTFNVSSAFAITDRFSISQTNRELYVLSRCKERRPPPSAVPVTNCSANSSGMYVYLGGNYGTGQPPENEGSCELAVFPVLGSEPAADMTAANYRRLIQGGFLLEWEPVGDCNACSASGGQCRYDTSTAAFACLCLDGSTRPSTCGKLFAWTCIFSVRIYMNVPILINFILMQTLLTSCCTFSLLLVSLPIAASMVFACLSYLIYHQKQKIISAVRRMYSANTSNMEEMLRKCGPLALRRYRYSELKKIMRSFKDELGEGGYGVVYRGTLQNGRMVAVKLLKRSKGNGEDFLNEVMSIGQTSHVNIVTLLDFSLEGSHRALIYEFMSNGSLQKHIYSESCKLAIGWETFLKIAIGIARGLEYLHQGCNTRIIHFDIKTNNILLDHNLCPKIADFGLAKLCHLKDSILSIAETRGTIGFIAPEVFSRGFGVVSTKSDVYSYGMMLLEMVREKKDLEGDADSSSDTFFPHWVYDRLATDLHSSEVTHGTEEIVRKMTLVGLWCIQMTPESRPSMSRVIEMLERNIGELEMPPKPFFCSPVYSTNVSTHRSVQVMMTST
uniref:Uncharacterized protein n=1 Tax=Avena sativa TaxID=4498 RepID=A0ACD5VKQ1_AVESA